MVTSEIGLELCRALFPAASNKRHYRDRLVNSIKSLLALKTENYSINVLTNNSTEGTIYRNTREKTNLSEKFFIEFYYVNEPIPPLGYSLVDQFVSKDDLRQVMANWYVNLTEQEARILYEYHEPGELYFLEEELQYRFCGCFIVRDKSGAVIQRVRSDEVRLSAEIATADPVWFERHNGIGEKSTQGDNASGTLTESRTKLSDLDEDIPF